MWRISSKFSVGIERKCEESEFQCGIILKSYVRVTCLGFWGTSLTRRMEMWSLLNVSADHSWIFKVCVGWQLSSPRGTALMWSLQRHCSFYGGRGKGKMKSASVNTVYAQLSREAAINKKKKMNTSRSKYGCVENQQIGGHKILSFHYRLEINCWIN